MTEQTTEGAQGAPRGDVPVELLVVLGPDGGLPTPPVLGEVPASWPPPVTPPLTAIEALRQLVPVSHDCPPRLALVALPAAAAEQIAAQPYVVGVYAAAPPEAVTARLRPDEQLFVDAWLLRLDDQRQRPERHGEGLPWDAEGHEPPDAPGSAVPGS
ncbi:hypothetical protein I6A84_44255 [Frankia sp. CNm7]|uniref:Uncharacterized protein n=1 Tax=Frankia nepalensis TaxID=1836974 RepID=A0A937RL23_9ACTN|nr:hypothetical protein [Frankia nepalensis]MBL7498508.1 hypothetical protein [Frankia nepalensis]MBL7514621.1 hypothetical protein [Frankia nepalensis]MBL7524868.1 hypothetical protein [Frankia nepalensis]MBL7630865.1 hypothetical protein [Frankia nepalensis]